MLRLPCIRPYRAPPPTAISRPRPQVARILSGVGSAYEGMEGSTDTLERLRSLGEHPVPEETAQIHLSRLRGGAAVVPTESTPRRGMIVGVAAAAVTLIVGVAGTLLLTGSPTEEAPSISPVADVPAVSTTTTPALEPPPEERSTVVAPFVEPDVSSLDEEPTDPAPPVSTTIGETASSTDTGSESSTEETVETPASDTGSDPFPGDPCKGPPPSDWSTEERGMTWEEYKAAHCDEPPTQGPSNPGGGD